MYKVVIVDDEPIIVEGMKRSLDWKKWECEVVAGANDGEEGRSVIQEHKPDILFSDIAMPGEDGLTMIAGLKSEFPNMEISILTGYRSFEYAQTAIKLGVTRFLLKPSNMGELEEAIQVMVDNLKQKNILPDKDKSEEKTEETSANSFIVKSALKYIDENYQKKLTLSKVADEVFVSQWHLSKLLNKHLGKNFSEILNTKRIEKAKELMRDKSLRLGDISEMVGFLDVAHFSKVFKNVEGIPANEYRNKRL